jgi:hypothetical protein
MKKIQGDKTEVKIISRTGNSVLVEYIANELPIRKYVPPRKFGKVLLTTLCWSREYRTAIPGEM